jgi:serine/threonine protein kinase
VAIEDYETIRELARGGMGVVYLARQRDPERLVALKRIEDWDEDLFQRFQREAQALARLSHPGIVRVHEVGVAPPYLAMELVEGESLEERLRQQGTLPPEEAARVVGELASAVAEAHAHGVLHRDLKPSNVLVGKGGRVVLIDFGLTRLEGATRLTVTGELLGTPAYMSPEQALGDSGSVGELSDVYGLGATLYALLSGRAPFAGGSALAVLQRVLEEEPAPLPPSGGLETICARAMAKEPMERYADARALAETLDAWSAGSRGTSPRRRGAQAAAALVLALGVGAIALRTVGSESSPRATPNVASVGSSTGESPSSPDSELEELRRQASDRPHQLGAGVPALRGWLRRYPTHASVGEVERLGEKWASQPIRARRFDLGKGERGLFVQGGAHGVWLLGKKGVAILGAARGPSAWLGHEEVTRTDDPFFAFVSGAWSFRVQGNWEQRSRVRLGLAPGGIPFTRLAWSRKAGCVAIGGAERVLTYDSEGVRQGEVTLNGRVRDVAVNSKGTHVAVAYAVASDGGHLLDEGACGVGLYRLPALEFVSESTWRGAAPTQVVFRADGKVLLGFGFGGLLTWDPRSGTGTKHAPARSRGSNPLLELRKVRALALDPASSKVFVLADVGSVSQLGVFDPRQGRELRFIDIPREVVGEVRASSMILKGDELYVACHNGWVLVYSARLLAE